MRTTWVLYQCPGNRTEELQPHVFTVVLALLSQLYRQVTAADVLVKNIWTWGSGRDGRRRLHLACGQVEVRDCQETTSLVVVGSNGQIQTFGIVVLGSEGRLSRVGRQLWCVDGERELCFYTGVAGVGVEDRGEPLDVAIEARSAGLTEAAGANSYFHAARSERVPDTPQWNAGSLRPRTWMPVPALNLLAEHSRPKLYSQLLLDIALWRTACQGYGVGNALAPAYTTCGHVDGRSVFATDLWIWALGQVVESVEGQLRACTERGVFEVQPLMATESSRATVVVLHKDGAETVAGFFVREEDLQDWMAAPVLGVLAPELFVCRPKLFQFFCRACVGVVLGFLPLPPRSRAIDPEAAVADPETENPDGKAMDRNVEIV